MTYVIRPAQPEHVPALLGLRREAEQWLHARGIRQWTPDYADYARDAITRAVQDGAAWVVVDGEDRVIATASLSTSADTDFWAWMDPQDRANALYIGKLIVSRAHAGVGLGDAILNWAVTRAARNGRDWLRLEARRDNTRLHAYYLQRGFQHVRTWHAPGRRTESGWLAQRPASLVLPAPMTLQDTPAPIASAPIGRTVVIERRNASTARRSHETKIRS